MDLQHQQQTTSSTFPRRLSLPLIGLSAPLRVKTPKEDEEDQETQRMLWLNPEDNPKGQPTAALSQLQEERGPEMGLKIGLQA